MFLIWRNKRCITTTRFTFHPLIECVSFFFIYKLNVNRFSFNHWIQHLRMCTNHRRILHNWKNKTKSVVLMYQNRKRFTPYQRVEILFDQCRSNRTFHLHVSQMNQSSFLQNNATIHVEKQTIQKANSIKKQSNIQKTK